MAIEFSQPDAVKAAKIIAAALDTHSQALERFTTKMDEFLTQFVATMNENGDKFVAAVDTLTTKLPAIGADIKSLSDQIAALQTHVLSDEGKAALQAIQDRFATMTGNVASAADAATALDALTPDAPPTPPVTP